MDKQAPKPSTVFWTNLANLLKVKTIITLAFVALLIMTTLRKVEVPQEIMMIASSVVTYFFSRQEKSVSDKADNVKIDNDKAETEVEYHA